MSDQFLLPCECGQTLPIGISQAGQELTCSCGRSITIPSMRAIRQLQPVKAATKAPEKTWNPVKGFIFGIGALLIIGGLVTAGHSYFVYSQVVDYKPSSAELSMQLEEIDKLSAPNLWELWHLNLDHPLEPAGSSPFAILQGMAKDKQQLVYMGLSVALAGLVCAVISLFIPAK